MYSCPTIIIGQLKFGDIAQLGERCVRNAEVTGSNPAISTMKAMMISEELVTMAFFLCDCPVSEARASAKMLLPANGQSGRKPSYSIVRSCANIS